tara:strand:- start:115 stop:477 length:363 start_codon:yes stop_codon:yes gene_type:complete
MLLIFIGSSIPGGEADEVTRQASGVKDPVQIQRIKDVVHIMEFGMLMLLLARTLRLQGYSKPLQAGFIITVLYGISDEAHQFFVPGRYPDMEDIIRNAAGAALGAFAVYVSEKRRRKRNT